MEVTVYGGCIYLTWVKRKGWMEEPDGVHVG